VDQSESPDRVLELVAGNLESVTTADDERREAELAAEARAAELAANARIRERAAAAKMAPGVGPWPVADEAGNVVWVTGSD